MKRNIVMLAGVLLLVPLCGCVTSMIVEQAANQAAPPTPDKFSFDVSTPGADAGTLTVQTRQPTYQGVVLRYGIKIDTNAPLIISKDSDVTIKVNAGRHLLKFYAASSDPAESEKTIFGRASNKDVSVAKDQELKLKYTGPYRLLGSGSVAEIK